MKLRLLPLLLLTGTVHADYFFNFNDPQGESAECRVGVLNHVVLDLDAYDITTGLNGDETDFSNYEGSFHKTLEHDAVTGLLTVDGKANYELLLTALSSGLQADFDAITRASGGARKFTSPQGSFTRSINGVPAALLQCPPAPKLNSTQAAADMIENYLMAICRDVDFKDYGTGLLTDIDDTIEQTTTTDHADSSKTRNAAAILNSLGDAYKGPRNISGNVTYQELFRGKAQGDLVGPYMSQFWYMSSTYVFNGAPFEPKVRIAQQREFGVSWADFVALQNGLTPRLYNNGNPLPDTIDFDDPNTQYIKNGRDLGTAVHKDGPGELQFYAVNALVQNNFPFSANLPYYNLSTPMPNEDPFVNMALVDIYSLIGQAAHEALKHAWAHKWRGCRRLRPEAMAGHVHRAKVDDVNPLGLDDSLFNTYPIQYTLNATDFDFTIDLLDWVLTYNHEQINVTDAFYTGIQADTYLLSQMYPEGSPMHPSYTAGHATFGSACSTILKAFFKNDTLMSSKITPKTVDANGNLVDISDTNILNSLRVGGELDKLASNIANGRDIAGVHYRSDGDESVKLGEQVALRLLQAKAHEYHESGFTGFVLTLRDGSVATVTPTAITIVV